MFVLPAIQIPRVLLHALPNSPLATVKSPKSVASPVESIVTYSITLTAFEKNFDRADLFARGYCNKKGKQHKLNTEKSRNYYFPSSLNIYNFDCITQNPE